MKNYKYLVMQIDGERGTFLSSDLGGSGHCTGVDTNVTHFKPHDYGGGHDNDNYWNSAEELLTGFCRWYLRTNEKEARGMGNRLHYATYTYKFFRVECKGFNNNKSILLEANQDLSPFEIPESDFIATMLDSWAFKQVSSMFPEVKFSNERTPPEPVEVDVVYNDETSTWCWFSDYLSFDYEDECTDLFGIDVPVGLDYDKALIYISEYLGCSYRFGGDDKYNKILS